MTSFYSLLQYFRSFVIQIGSPYFFPFPSYFTILYGPLVGQVLSFGVLRQWVISFSPKLWQDLLCLVQFLWYFCVLFLFFFPFRVCFFDELLLRWFLLLRLSPNSLPVRYHFPDRRLVIYVLNSYLLTPLIPIVCFVTVVTVSLLL